MKERVQYWDGLRAVFCIVVLIHHFMLAFYPKVPIFLINDGNLAVVYFLMLSGFVMPLKFYNNKKEVENTSVKAWMKFTKNRYIRFLPVVVISIMCSWLIQVCGGYCTQAVSNYYHLEPIGKYYDTGLTFIQALYEAFIQAFIQRPMLDAPLWSL